MRRRAFVSLAGAAAVAWPARTTAQQSGKMHRLGVLSAGPRPGEISPLWRAFLQALRDKGYSEGRDLTFELRYADGNLERLPELAVELVSLKVDIIVVAGPSPIPAAKAATSTIPIVMIAGSSDPIGEGLIASFARPGGNITGLTYAVSSERFGKQLEVLKQAVGRVSRVAVLWDLDVELYGRTWAPFLERAASQLDMQVIGPFVVHDAGGFERAFGEMTLHGVDAVLVASGGMIFANRARVGQLAIQFRIPMMAAFREFTQSGGLLSYGPDFPDIYRRAATYVDKILKGARPADLAVEQPVKYDLTVNLRTAKALGITMPESILASADEVIE